MTYTLSEPLINALVSRLTSDLPAEVAAVNTRTSDGFQISMPEVMDFIPPPGLLVNYPAIGIGEAPASFEDDIGSSATGVFELLVVVYEQAADQRELAWKLRRHSQAVSSTVLKGRQLGPAWGVTLRHIDPGETLVDDPTSPQEWMSWVGLRIVCRTDQE